MSRSSSNGKVPLNETYTITPILHMSMELLYNRFSLSSGAVYKKKNKIKKKKFNLVTGIGWGTDHASSKRIFADYFCVAKVAHFHLRIISQKRFEKTLCKKAKPRVVYSIKINQFKNRYDAFMTGHQDFSTC
ncbi:hypothetical protein BpHYR1_034497 [Brachionus plicatilis]|uniref:Uncharacterized protein n=1 Tax=Brachionus plicatilis TaxID=10195 RepID=A0A3M7RPQ2_BRAPC|nr:hypothetical protein BpHYR1_034497 [Brachionus plicatilis]